MLRAGMIRKLAAGLYTWSPLGLRVLRKVEAHRARGDGRRRRDRTADAVDPAEGAVGGDRALGEVRRPAAEDQGPQGSRVLLGPTHEEVITDFARNELASYKQLPVNFYQIQTKFRDEIRPRFGVMRAREFLMKDAYSFHLDDADLAREYGNMRDAYTRIFTRLGLKFRAVQADSGAIGGDASQEFHVLADSGEDAIAFSTAPTTPRTSRPPTAAAPGARPAASGRCARSTRRRRRPARTSPR